MATFCRASSSIFVFLLVLTAGRHLPMAKGDICTEDLGACDPECGSRCISAHPGGKSGCESNNNNPVCRCYYDCEPPAPPGPPPYSRKCKISLGFWGADCDEDECTAECATKFPGPQQGFGYCYSVGAPVYTSCFCEYKC